MSKTSKFKRNITILTGLSITTLHVINRIEFTNASLIKVKTNRENKTYDWRYGKIKYKKKGNGAPLLLLHDLTIGSNKSEFQFIYEELSKIYTVYVPDIIGYGDSDKPSMTITASVIEQLISDFIKVVIGTKTNVVATGSTAPFVLKIANDNSKLIDRIIMINPLGLYDQNLIPSNQTKFLKILMEMPIIGTFIYNVNSTRNSILQDFTNKYLCKPNNFDSDILNNIVDEYYRASHTGGFHSKYSHASYKSQYMTCSILHEIKELNNSILIIGGDHEPEINCDIENYNYYNGSIESVLIENTAHLPHIEKPSDVIDQIGVFLS